MPQVRPSKRQKQKQKQNSLSFSSTSGRGAYITLTPEHTTTINLEQDIFENTI